VPARTARPDPLPRKKRLAKGLLDDEAAVIQRGHVLVKPGRYLGAYMKVEVDENSGESSIKKNASGRRMKMKLMKDERMFESESVS
jgi:hypothetical protein